MSGNFLKIETSSFFPSAQMSRLSASPSLSPGKQSLSLLFIRYFTVYKARELLPEPRASRVSLIAGRVSIPILQMGKPSLQKTSSQMEK